MHRLYPALMDALAASIFLVPYLMYPRTKHDQKTAITGLLILFCIYLSAVYSIAGLPSLLHIHFRPNLNMKPFLYMFSDYKTSFLNVLLFMPLGFFLPVLWEKYQKIQHTLLTGFLISVIIEFMQLFTCRATDINDLITNTAGTLLGYCCGILSLKCFPSLFTESEIRSLSSIAGCVSTVMFMLQPVFLNLILS